VFSTLINTSGGDLRRAITYLQSASRLSSSTNPPTDITPLDIQEIAGVVPDDVINDFASGLGVEILNAGSMDVDDGKKPKKKGFELVRQKVRQLMREGYSASQILIQLHDLVILHPTLDGKQKSKSAMVFAEADKALCDGADEELWILEVGLRLYRILS
jgi:replication factor C subunit 2/4